MVKSIELRSLIEIAGGLVSEHGENQEYDRALAEICTEASGWSMEQRDLMLRKIREGRKL